MKLEQLNLIDVLTDYGVSLERRGQEFWSSCPFHEDSRPSFSVTGNVWYCFSCKRGGSTIEFVAAMEKVSRPVAVKILIQKYKLEHKEDPARDVLTSAVELLVPYHGFLDSRGISEETARKYKVGFCEDYESLLRILQVDREHAESIGLFDVTGCMVYPFFDQYGCFKIHARSVIDKAYRGSSKSSLWKPSLWGIEHIRSKKVFAFEGFHDVMIASQYGIPAVALCGTNVCKEFWDQLADYDVEEVVFVPDGDFGGRSLLNRLVREYDTRFRVKVVELASGDPDESIIRKDVWVEELPLQWFVGKKEVNTLDDKIALYQEIAPMFSRLKDWEREIFRDFFRGKFGSSGLDFLVAEIKPDRKSERVVLANCIYSNQARLDAVRELDVDDFTLPMHRSLFELARQGQLNPVLVQKNFDVDLSQDADLTSASYFLEEVKKASIRFKLYQELGRARSRIESSDPSELIGGLSQKMFSFVDNRDLVHDASSVTRRVVDAVTERVKNPGVLGVPLSDAFPVLNRSLLGFVPGKFILLSGPTGHGKTTLAQVLIDDLLFEKNEGVLFFSLEMSPDEIVEKQIAIRTGISGTKILTGSLEQSEYDAVLGTAKKLLSSRLKIVHGTFDLYKIISMAQSVILQSRCKVVVLDYIQLVTVPGTKRDRWAELMDISAMIKKRICSLGVTVLGVSQLGKGALSSSVAEAKDQSGSYGMLADADVAITIRQKNLDELKEGSNLEIFVDKHRYGRDKVLIPALFDKGTCRIREV